MLKIPSKTFLIQKVSKKIILLFAIPALFSLNVKAETGYISLNLEVDAANFNNASDCQFFMTQFKKKYETCSQQIVSSKNLVQSVHDENDMTSPQLAQESELKVLKALDAELLTMRYKIDDYAIYPEILSSIVETRISVITQQKSNKKLSEYNFTDYKELITEYRKFNWLQRHKDLAVIAGYFSAGGKQGLTWLSGGENASWLTETASPSTWWAYLWTLPPYWAYLSSESIFNYFIIIKPGLFTIPDLIIEQYESHELNVDSSKIGLKYSSSPQDLLHLPVAEACTDLKQSYLLQAATRVAEQFYNSCNDPDQQKSLVIPSAYLKP